MREAQSVFDGAQAERARTLAAFAVTVGSDAAVAELLGLNEREVRIARRTVGKSDARSLAGTLLSRPPAGAPDIGAAAKAASGDGGPPPAPRGVDPAVTARPQPRPPSIPAPRVEQFATRQAGPAAPTGAKEWSHTHDSLLVDGWNKGTDAAALAAQLGVGLTQLVSRAQLLYADGRLTRVRRDRGRHRRPTDEFARAVENADGFDRALFPNTNETPSWSPPDGAHGQGENAPHTSWSQEGSSFCPSQVNSALGNSGYPVAQRWAHDWPAGRGAWGTS
ncbi:hypothetical protein [Streptomyces sp.]|uniref:hypothetical protein n=1 Tax=Streptomyces sp. TaxID=1931 RepID=UPI002D802564|nr:hypothetical protein [Streptomyces sp.]